MLLTFFRKIFIFPILFFSIIVFSQYQPSSLSSEEIKKANDWVNKTYHSLSQSEKLGQLFIIALYNNKGEEFINNVKKITLEEQLGGLILMQDDAKVHVNIVNELQAQSKIPMLIGMDAEWGLYQRIAAAHKFPWAITLGAIQDKSSIEKMAAQIATDAKRMGVNWDFAPVVDVNTNPKNPIIGNRSFGSDVQNVVSSAYSYAQGLQNNQVLAAIKHFPGHGDTSTDSHLDLPVVDHDLQRLNSIELAPFKALMDRKIGGVMVAHLYVPALEKGKNIPASLSKSIVTDLLKNTYGYKGLIITDALNMGAVAKKYAPGELDALAFKAGNDIMLFSENVKKGKELIQKAIDNGEIPQSRVEESVKKILLTKYYLGLQNLKPVKTENLLEDLNNSTHRNLVESLYSEALTLIKDEKKLLPLECDKTYYYVPLEEAPYEKIVEQLNLHCTVLVKKPSEIGSIPTNSTVIVGFHKDNSTAYKPYKISSESKNILQNLTKNHNVILSVFGSPYALMDVNIDNVSTVLVAYENNDDSLSATAKALKGRTRISGRLPVVVNDKLKYGTGIDLYPRSKINFGAPEKIEITRRPISKSNR